MTFNFWAGARAAAGVASESVDAASVEDALDALLTRHDDDRFRRVIRASSLLVDGVAASSGSVGRPLDEPTTVEVLPPFAGG